MNMIYCVEDEEIMCDLMVYTLNNSGYQAEGFGDGEGLKKALKAETPELIILDVILPGESGLEILKQLRRNPETHSTPVILATSKTSEIDRVQGLDLGADDYMVKPFEAKELIARIKAVMRRSGGQGEEKKVSFDNLVISLDNYSVMLDGKPVEMPPKEIELLYFLASRPGKVFTREQLLEQVWGFDFFGDSRTVDVHVKRIREKLGERDEWQLKTVWGVGYKFDVAK